MYTNAVKSTRTDLSAIHGHNPGHHLHICAQLCIEAEFWLLRQINLSAKKLFEQTRLVDRIGTWISRPACLNLIERLSIRLLLINEQNNAIEFGSKERKGIAMTYRNITGRISYGTPDVSPLKRQIEEGIRSAQEVDGRYGKELKTAYGFAGLVEK
jgi:hypothetical protein